MRTHQILKALVLSGMMIATMPSGFAASSGGCSGDPCATTSCEPGHASGTGYGSEEASANARVGVVATEAHAEPGGAHTEAAGQGDVSASASGYKDWSWASAHASCSLRGSDLLAMQSAGIALSDVSIGCVADERIASSASLTGGVYLAESGLWVVDEGRGEGIALDALRLVLDGETLSRVVPVDVSILLPTGLTLAMSIVDGGEDDEDRCSISLS